MNLWNLWYVGWIIKNIIIIIMMQMTMITISTGCTHLLSSDLNRRGQGWGWGGWVRGRHIAVISQYSRPGYFLPQFFSDFFLIQSFNLWGFRIKDPGTSRIKKTYRSHISILAPGFFFLLHFSSFSTTFFSFNLWGLRIKGTYRSHISILARPGNFLPLFLIQSFGI